MSAITENGLRAVVTLLAVAQISGCGLGGGQTAFDTETQALEALAAAVKSGESRTLLRILGEESQPLIESGDPVTDANARQVFTDAFTAHHELVDEGPDRKILVIGGDAWPFPFPLVRDGSKWEFRASDGIEELVNRRIGANELSAIQACLAYVDAQFEYYRLNPEGDALLHYARRLVSTPGRKDGLYWESRPGEPQSPLGQGFADARAAGYVVGDPAATRDPADFPAETRRPFYGYYYRMLEAQGPAARAGAYDYVVQDQLLGGFGLVAYPAEYGSTGIMTFIVNFDGEVFSKDLGADTATAAAQITRYDPDSSWTREKAD